MESAAWTQRWRSGQWVGRGERLVPARRPGITGLYACQGANNMTGFCDPDLDEHPRALRPRAGPFETRKPLLDEAQAKLAEQARTLPLYHNVMPEVVKKRVRGYRGSGTNFGSFWNLCEWTLEEAGQ